MVQMLLLAMESDDILVVKFIRIAELRIQPYIIQSIFTYSYI